MYNSTIVPHESPFASFKSVTDTLRSALFMSFNIITISFIILVLYQSSSSELASSVMFFRIPLQGVGQVYETCLTSVICDTNVRFIEIMGFSPFELAFGVSSPIIYVTMVQFLFNSYQIGIRANHHLCTLGPMVTPVLQWSPGARKKEILAQSLCW